MDTFSSHISELMLAMLIQGYNKKSFHFKNERRTALHLQSEPSCETTAFYDYKLSVYLGVITKTCLFKYTEHFNHQKMKIFR